MISVKINQRCPNAPVYIKPTGTAGGLVTVEIGYPYSASSDEYYSASDRRSDI